MDKYIKYHRKPYAKYLTVSQFNNKYDYNIGVNSEFDAAFSAKFKKLKLMCNGDYIVGNFNVSEPIPLSVESLESAIDIDSEIEEIVLERAKTKEQGEKDLKNIVHFKNGDDLRKRLMKGTKKNIQKLKDYVNGTDSTIRLSYRKQDKEVKISELNPNMASLKAFLNDRTIRDVNCV